MKCQTKSASKGTRENLNISPPLPNSSEPYLPLHLPSIVPCLAASN